MPTRPLTHAQLQHQKRASARRYNAERVTVHGTDPRGTRRWRRLRAGVMNAQPLCTDPYGLHASSGRVEVATELDHVVGLRQRPDLAFTLANLQPLCHACHARKSQEERAIAAPALQ